MKNIFAAHYYDSSKISHSNKLEGLELAGFPRRLFALLIDLLLLIVILYLIGTLLDYFGIINFGFNITINSEKAVTHLPVINNDTHFDVPEYLIILSGIQ